VVDCGSMSSMTERTYYNAQMNANQRTLCERSFLTRVCCSTSHTAPVLSAEAVYRKLQRNKHLRKTHGHRSYLLSITVPCNLHDGRYMASQHAPVLVVAKCIPEH